MQKMPDSLKGKVYKKSKFVKTNPRQWTEGEIDYLLELHKMGWSNLEMAECMDRSEVSISVKLKRLGKKKNKYDSAHHLEKVSIDFAFVNFVQPKSILTLTGGTKENEFLNKEEYHNEIYKNVNSSFGEKGLKILCQKYIDDKSYDYIDLDTFSSSYDSFDLAIKSANKGISITLSELGHKRWKRLDFVSRYYGIDNLEQFTIENLISHIQTIGLKNKKNLVVYKSKEWNNIGRVWFIIEPVKVLDVQFKLEKNEEIPTQEKQTLVKVTKKVDKTRSTKTLTIFDFQNE